jgi:hypothetical protein
LLSLGESLEPEQDRHAGGVLDVVSLLFKADLQGRYAR